MLEPTERQRKGSTHGGNGNDDSGHPGRAAFYCFVQGITPGPANLCSLATTLRYGRTLALRQWYGLIAGFYAVSFASVLVVWTVGQVASGLTGWLTVAGAVYVLWLAWTMVAPSREGHALYEAKPRRLRASSCRSPT